MKKIIKVVLLMFVLVIPFSVNAIDWNSHLSKELISSTDNSNGTKTYKYAINLYSDSGEYIDALSIKIIPKVDYSNPLFTHVGFGYSSYDSENDVYNLGNFDGNSYRVNGGTNNKIGEYTFTLSNDLNPDEAFDMEITNGAGAPVYWDTNNYSLSVSDVNDMGEYTIDIIVGSLVFDFNENFDGTFTWEPHGEAGIKINNLSNKAIRVGLDFDSNVSDLRLDGLFSLRHSATNVFDCLGYYAVTAQDHSVLPDEFKSNTYDNTGLFARTYFTDSSCTVPLENGAEFDETKEYYYVDHVDREGFEQGFNPAGHIFDIDAYDEREYVYPGLDYHLSLTGGSLDDVKNIQKGNKKIGTISLTIVGV